MDTQEFSSDVFVPTTDNTDMDFVDIVNSQEPEILPPPEPRQESAANEHAHDANDQAFDRLMTHDAVKRVVAHLVEGEAAIADGIQSHERNEDYGSNPPESNGLHPDRYLTDNKGEHEKADKNMLNAEVARGIQQIEANLQLSHWERSQAEAELTAFTNTLVRLRETIVRQYETRVRTYQSESIAAERSRRDNELQKLALSSIDEDEILRMRAVIEQEVHSFQEELEGQYAQYLANLQQQLWVMLQEKVDKKAQEIGKKYQELRLGAADSPHYISEELKPTTRRITAYRNTPSGRNPVTYDSPPGDALSLRKISDTDSSDSQQASSSIQQPQVVQQPQEHRDVHVVAMQDKDPVPEKISQTIHSKLATVLSVLHSTLQYLESKALEIRSLVTDLESAIPEEQKQNDLRVPMRPSEDQKETTSRLTIPSAGPEQPRDMSSTVRQLRLPGSATLESLFNAAEFSAHNENASSNNNKNHNSNNHPKTGNLSNSRYNQSVNLQEAKTKLSSQKTSTQARRTPDMALRPNQTNKTRSISAPHSQQSSSGRSHTRPLYQSARLSRSRDGIRRDVAGDLSQSGTASSNKQQSFRGRSGLTMTQQRSSSDQANGHFRTRKTAPVTATELSRNRSAKLRVSGAATSASVAVSNGRSRSRGSGGSSTAENGRARTSDQLKHLAANAAVLQQSLLHSRTRAMAHPDIAKKTTQNGHDAKQDQPRVRGVAPRGTQSSESQQQTTSDLERMFEKLNHLLKQFQIENENSHST